MSTTGMVTYLSFGVGLFGIIIAFYQGFERRKLKQYVYSQAWHIFSISNISFATIQSALKAYKEIYKDKLDPLVFEPLSKCEAHSINLFIESIRQIHLSEPKFNFETITGWAMQGKITKEQAQYFIRMMPMERPNLIALAWNSLTLRLKQKLINRIGPQQKKENTQSDSKPPTDV